MRLSNLVVLLPLLASAAARADDPAQAQDIIAQAVAKAKAEHKKVLVDFSASWCPWCVKLEKLYTESPFAKLFEKDFVIAQVTIVERPELKNRTNPGWEKLMLDFRKHKDQDIPYVVLLDAKGRQLTDSFEKYGSNLPNNAGFPQTDEEISAFQAQLKRYAPSFQAKDLAALGAYFIKVRTTAGHH